MGRRWGTVPGAALALASCLTAGDAAAQFIDHERVQALLARIEAATPADGGDAEGAAAPPGAPLTTQSASSQAPTLAPAPAPPPAPVPAPAVPDAGSDPLFADVFGGAMPDGSGCPTEPNAFEAAVDDVEAEAGALAREVDRVAARYDDLDEANLAFVTSSAIECPAADVEAQQDFLADVAALSISPRLLAAENLGVCAQTTATRLDRAMQAIAVDAGRAEQSERRRMGQILGAVSAFDARVTAAVQRMVVLEQKRQRLALGVETFADGCAVGVTFGTEYQ